MYVKAIAQDDDTDDENLGQIKMYVLIILKNVSSK